MVISPAILGPAYFREAAEVIGAAAGGPPDREKMMDVLRRHGMTVAARRPPSSSQDVWLGARVQARREEHPCGGENEPCQ